MREQKKNTRRRGAVLEETILNATLEELSENGYQNLTMENVAVRAKTSKAVLYRRWPNKSKLVVAALHKNIPHTPHVIPNTGDLRDDLFIYLKNLMEPLNKIDASTIRGLMTEQFSGAFIDHAPQILRPRAEDKSTTAIMEILENAELRGDIKKEKLDTRTISLPIDLLRYEMITRLEPVTDKTIADIVDNIFIPLIYAKASY